MREALAELVRLINQFRHGIPWDKSEDAYHRVPLLAIIFSVSISVALAGSLWYVSPSFYFNPWALLILFIPATSGFYLTYLFDLLGIGLGWRTIDIVLQLVLGLAVFYMGSSSVFGLAAGLLTAVFAWVSGVRCGSDLVAMRPDKLQAGYFDEKGELTHPGLQRILRSQLAYLTTITFAVGFLARWQGSAAPWWVSTMTGIGTTSALVVGFMLTGWAQKVVELRTWEKTEILVQPGVAAAWHAWVRRIVMFTGLIGFILPANVSPLGRISLDKLFNGINSKLSPLFVRTGTYSSSRTPSGFGAKMAEGVEHLDTLHLGGVMNVLLYLALGIGAVVIFWLLWPLLNGNTAQRPAYYGKEKGLWRWLWDAIRSWFRKATGLLLDAAATDESRAGGGWGRGKAHRRRQFPKEPEALVRYLFALYLDKGAESGRGRYTEETVIEYKERITPDLAPQGATAVAELTNMYQQIRYGQQQADTKFAGLFKRCWAVAVRAMRSLTS